MQLNNQEEALRYVDTEIKQKWVERTKQDKLLAGITLGDATIYEESAFNGHKAWRYEIEGLPKSRDGRKCWLIDTGETLDTTLTDDTLEKAYAKRH